MRPLQSVLAATLSHGGFGITRLHTILNLPLLYADGDRWSKCG
jgi:hypothetical protein